MGVRLLDRCPASRLALRPVWSGAPRMSGSGCRVVEVNSLFSPIPRPNREGAKRRGLGSHETEGGAVVAGSESRLVDD